MIHPPLERTTHESVQFLRSFRVDGMDGEQPAGTYQVETVEALIEGVSVMAYLRVSTGIRLPLAGHGASSYQLIPIDPQVVATGRRSGPEVSEMT